MSRTEFCVLVGIVIALIFTWTFQPSAQTAGSVLDRTDLIYSSEIGAWQTDGGPAANEATGVPARVREAGVRMIRFSVYDCFTGMVCGNDNHNGSQSRTSFNHAIQSGVIANNALLWLKMVPIADDLGPGVKFCPPWTGAADKNLPMYKEVVRQVSVAGYTGPLVIESNNEMEYTCWRQWQSQGAPITGAGSVGVSKRIGEHYAATMPALKTYAQSLGFSEVVVGGYIGVGGGPGWGQTCSVNATARYGYSCGYQSRWIDEFNTAVKNAGVQPPNFVSIHAYPHSPDFSSTSGYEFDDRIVYAYYSNWAVQTKARLAAIWGTNNIKLSISEWNAGISNSSGTWSGWTTTGRPEQFYGGWFDMLKEFGFWNANLFLIAGNSDTGSGRFYNIIKQDGSVPSWYYTFREKSLGAGTPTPTPTVTPTPSPSPTPTSTCWPPGRCK